MSGEVVEIRDWYHPRQALALTIAALNIPRDEAVMGLMARLISGRITAICEDYCGPTDEGNCLNQEERPMVLWKGLWLNHVFRSPFSPLWNTGDLEATLGPETIVFINIRFNARAVDQALKHWASGDPTRLPHINGHVEPMKIAQPVSSKWDWEAALTELVALANLPDGLSASAGFDPPARGSQARLEEWFEQYFSSRHNGEAPSEIERRKRAQAVMKVVNKV